MQRVSASLGSYVRSFRKRGDELAKTVLPNKQAGLGIHASFAVSILVGHKISIYYSDVTGNRGSDTLVSYS